MNRNLEIYRNKYSNAEISKDTYLEFLKDMRIAILENQLKILRKYLITI